MKSVLLHRRLLSRLTQSAENSTNARFAFPKITGEPFKHYAPGAPETLALYDAITELKSSVLEIPCVVNGEEFFTGDVVEQVMPSKHGHVLARFHQATPDVMTKAIETSEQARHEWATMPFLHRAMIFRKAADLIGGKYRAKINAATMLGVGKTIWQAEIDAAVESVDFLRLNTNYAEQIYAVQPPLNSPNTWNRLEYRELEGFVYAISPFNFCAIGANLCTAPALMGNTVLWKPSNTAVLGNYFIYQILQEAGLPPGVISFLPSTPDVAGQAIAHRSFAGLHFTGSTKTFNTLWQQIGQNLPKYASYPRIVGETGGKNFHLVHKSVGDRINGKNKIFHAVNNTVRSAFEYQGQKCSACSRAYVPRSVWEGADGFKQQLVDTMKTIHQGQADDPKAFMSAVIDRTAFNKHKYYIDRAKKSPECEIIAGGTYDDSVGYFVHPTVIETTNPHYETMETELFGPILTVFVYEDENWEETLKLVDSTGPYALTGSIFAADRRAIVQAEDALRNSAGNFYINDKSTGAVVGEQPFGGARGSGTNDKAGSHLNLLRWVNARTVKENTADLNSITYPHMK